MQKILFRTDASSTLGTSHVIRDLVLAKQYPKDEVMFATRSLKGNLNKKIKERGYKVKRLKSNSSSEFIDLVKKLKIDMVIIDHYHIDYAFEKELKEQTNVKIMVLDDTYEKHHCDILLNHNIYADERRYKELVPTHCELRCGEEFALLRDEFYQAKEKREKSLKKESNSTIKLFLAMGEVDTEELNIPILEALEEFDNIHTCVVTTSANKKIKELKKYVRGKKNITLHINSDDIANIMATTQMAIITPSSILQEANFMDLLFIPIQTTVNQKEMVSFLEANEYPVLKEFDGEVLYHTVKSFLIFHQQ